MRNYAPFRTIADSLAAGREIEFSSHGKAYSITNSGGYWHFCCDCTHGNYLLVSGRYSTFSLLRVILIGRFPKC